MEHKLVNIMENSVLSTIDKIAPQLNCCTCNKCKLELAAYVLNRIPPKYADSEKGSLYARANHMTVEFNNKLIMEITQAATDIGKPEGHD